MATYRNPKIYVTTPPQTPFDRWQKRKRIAAAIFAAVFALGFFWLLFFSPVFAVSEIFIEGDAPPEVQPRFDAFRNHNIFRLDAGALEQELKATYPHIKSVTIYRGLPNALKIVVASREEVFVWESGGVRYLIDTEGIPFQTAVGETSLPLVVDLQKAPVILGKPVASPDFARFVAVLGKDFHLVTGLAATSLTIVETTFQIDVLTDRGFRVLFDTTRKAEPQLAALKKLLEGYTGPITAYIDLRIAGKAYVK